jgi:hypothetical protein
MAMRPDGVALEGELVMARGWESKSIESQQADASADRSPRKALTPEALAIEGRRRELNLARSSVAADLERAAAPAHRQMLVQALADLDSKIRGLE